MTRAEIEIRLSDIRASHGDDEAAHGMEDDLYRDFLIALQNGLVPAPDVAELAGLILTSTEIKFARWCA